jgi:hypothetical protein
VRRIKRRYDVPVTQLIADGDPQVGETLTSVRRQPLPTGVLRKDGSVAVTGRVRPSLSAAAQASSGNKTEPGWDYWTVHRDGKAVTLLELRAAYVRRQEAGAT